MRPQTRAQCWLRRASDTELIHEMNEQQVTAFVAALVPRAHRVFALIDGARDRDVLTRMQNLKIEHHSLFAGLKAVTLDRVAPYLVPFAALLPHAQSVIPTLWGKSWSVCVESDLLLEKVRLQLKKSLMVEDEDGEQAYFRFYDSRALERFIDSCTNAQLDHFFGEAIDAVIAIKSGSIDEAFCVRPTKNAGFLRTSPNPFEHQIIQLFKID